MDRKRIYTSSVAISAQDLKYLKSIKESGKYKRKSIAGVLSEIINNDRYGKQGKVL